MENSKPTSRASFGGGMNFQGIITEGKLLLDNKPQFQSHLHTLGGKRIEVSVERFQEEAEP
jgi:hypothetical protein